MDEQKRRLVENEALFREVNERIRDVAGTLHGPGPFGFLCECSNRDCETRVHLSLEEYEAVRAQSDRFWWHRGMSFLTSSGWSKATDILRSWTRTMRSSQSLELEIGASSDFSSGHQRQRYASSSPAATRSRSSSTNGPTRRLRPPLCRCAGKATSRGCRAIAVRARALWRTFRGAPVIALAITTAAWISLALAHRTGDARFTGGFLLLAATAMILSFFSLYVERRWAAYVAFLITLAAPVATVIYISRQPTGWLS